ncbi:SMI1/KNR4 family protein [Mycolicibacterium brisbanense]
MVLNEAVTSQDVWQPYLARLASHAVRHGCDVTSIGSFSAGSYGMTGAGGSWMLPLDDEVITTLQAEAADCAIAYCGVGRPDGSAEITMVDAGSPQLDGMAGQGMVDGVVLTPGVMPEPYRRQPELIAGQAFSPGSDPELVSRIVQRQLPGVPAADAALVAAAERAFGQPLPPDVRAFYGSAACGSFWSANEDADPELPTVTRGMRIVPVDDVEGRAWFQPQRRYLSWMFGAATGVVPDRFEQVQPVGHSPAWFVVGDDEAGGWFVVDMAPGPNGTIGQLLHVDRDVMAGAQWLAPSLTEYLQNGAVIGPRFDFEDPTLGLVARAMADVGPCTEVLQLHNVSGPVDLALLAGHPRLRSAFISSAAVTGLDALTRLPALEFLSLPMVTWHVVIDDGLIPDGVHAVGFADAGRSVFSEPIEIANRLLHHRGQPPIEVVRFAGGAPGQAAR